MNQAQKNLSKGIGIFVMVSWINRILGLISVFILARLLTPEQFGVVALLMIIIGIADALSSVGSEQYYIQHKKPSTIVLYSAWTLNLTIKTLISALLVASSPFVLAKLEKPELIFPYVILALIPFISSCANSRLMQLKRELKLAPFFKLSVISTATIQLISIFIALVYQSYWALIIGHVGGTLLFTLGSYIVAKPNFRFSVSMWKEQIEFSRWILAKGFIGHFRAKMDTWFVASHLPASQLGGYTVSKDIALIPSRHVLSPISDAFYSAIGSSENGSIEQRLLIRQLLFLVTAIAMPISVGWMIIAEAFVGVVLGDKWLNYAAALKALGILVVTFSIGNAISQIFTAVGKVKALFVYDLITTLISLFIYFLVLTALKNAEDFSLARAMIGLVTVFVAFMFLKLNKIMNLTQLIKPYVYIIFCSAVMYAATISLIPHELNIKFLLLSIGVGGLVYLGCIYIGIKSALIGADESKWCSDYIRKVSSRIKK